MQERITLRGEDYILTTPGETRSAISDLYEREQEEPKFRAVPLNPDELSAWHGRELANIPPWVPDFKDVYARSYSARAMRFWDEKQQNMQSFFQRALVLGLTPTMRRITEPQMIMPAPSPDVSALIRACDFMNKPHSNVMVIGGGSIGLDHRLSFDLEADMKAPGGVFVIDSIPDFLWHTHAMTSISGVQRKYRDGVQVSGPPPEPEPQTVGHPKRNRAKAKAKKAARKRNRK